MMFRTNAMRHRVAHLTRSMTAGSRGENTESFAASGQYWAEIETIRGREADVGNHVEGQLTHRVYLRANSTDPIRPKDRIQFGSREFEIESIDDKAHVGQYLVLQCIELRV